MHSILLKKNISIPKFCTKYAILHLFADIYFQIKNLKPNLLTGLFTHIINGGTGDRRLLVLNTHQGGCNHATKYKYQYSRFFSELLPIQK
jgi:hypothetical protein